MPGAVKEGLELGGSVRHVSSTFPETARFNLRGVNQVSASVASSVWSPVQTRSSVKLSRLATSTNDLVRTSKRWSKEALKQCF